MGTAFLKHLFFFRSVVIASNLWQTACKDTKAGRENAGYVVLSNKLVPVLELLNARLQVRFHFFQFFNSLKTPLFVHEILFRNPF